ncbi:MAG TPA: FmdB family zinc ribbon protein [Bryobacteraceae bacterium]|nr:FmdB family zinc ribbon protein [Bryobacteraceae bacterium]
MPIYEYKCEGCGETFVVIQKFADEPVTVHEKCGGHVHRLMSAPSFQFKGSGWYVTDYAKGSGNVPAKPDSHKDDSGKSESGKSESGKSESGRSESGKSESSKSDSSSKTSGDTATKTESKPAPSSNNSAKND